MKGQNIAILVFVLLVIGGSFYFFSTQKQRTQPEEVIVEEKTVMTDESANVSPTGEAAMMEEDVNEIVISGSNFKFDPNTITVKKGQKNRIVFKNIQGMHDFKVDELRIATHVIKDGEEESVEFTADETGTFEFYCSVGQHRANGMKGTLIVE